MLIDNLHLAHAYNMPDKGTLLIGKLRENFVLVSTHKKSTLLGTYLCKVID